MEHARSQWLASNHRQAKGRSLCCEGGIRSIHYGGLKQPPPKRPSLMRPNATCSAYTRPPLPDSPMKLNKTGYILKKVYERHHGLNLSITDLAEDLSMTKRDLLSKIQGSEPSSLWLKAQQVKLSRLGYPQVLFIWSDDVLYIETARRQHGTIEIVDATRTIRNASSVH